MDRRALKNTSHLGILGAPNFDVDLEFSLTFDSVESRLTRGPHLAPPP
jgi:hypothetical protein